MKIEQICSTCGQPLSVAKQTIWQFVTKHLEGSSIASIVQATGYTKATVKKWLNELCIEEKVGENKEKRKWYPEMAVSRGHHSH